MVGHVLISPELMLAAAAELDLLAERLVAASTLSGPATHVLPSGCEEVSLLAAGHFNHAAATHDGAVAQGALELHHAAHTLRMQCATFLADDTVQAASVAAVGGAIQA
ncbi:PE domain-containing protein [Nocardia wallacei]|uniref:PE domain-containing protein n=1 Tax=Nocardia wallacei TaxID=480035 RepID=UPI0024560910|nr:PE domain-containing protein [Nocardia wallacei]